MKKTLLIPVAMMFLLVAGCKNEKAAESNGDSIQHDSAAAIADTTLWGHMGDGTSMNVMEFVSDKGDTLYLCRTSEQTGEEADILGDIRNNTDRFAVTTRGANVDEGLSIRTCINVSQLMGVWKNGNDKLSFYVDGTADNEQRHYKQWNVMNGHLIISGKTKTEYGETDRIDTMRILMMTEDSLTLLTPQHEELKYGK